MIAVFSTSNNQEKNQITWTFHLSYNIDVSSIHSHCRIFLILFFPPVLVIFFHQFPFKKRRSFPFNCKITSQFDSHIVLIHVHFDSFIEKTKKRKNLNKQLFRALQIANPPISVTNQFCPMKIPNLCIHTFCNVYRSVQGCDVLCACEHHSYLYSTQYYWIGACFSVQSTNT